VTASADLIRHAIVHRRSLSTIYDTYIRDFSLSPSGGRATARSWFAVFNKAAAVRAGFCREATGADSSYAG
jgi:hypothetical protein